VARWGIGVARWGLKEKTDGMRPQLFAMNCQNKGDDDDDVAAIYRSLTNTVRNIRSANPRLNGLIGGKECLVMPIAR
jgi:hypothetical protein